MPKVITVETETWCPKNCAYFHLGENKFYGNNTLLNTYYYCENLSICRNAANAIKEYDKMREELMNALLGHCNESKKEVTNGRGNES